MEFATDSGSTVPVQIRRRKGTRHLRLSLGHQNQIVVSAPWHVSDFEVSRFIETQRPWVGRQLERVPGVYTLGEWLALHPRLTASGDVFAVRIEGCSRRLSHYCFEHGGAVLVLRLTERSESALRQLVRRFAKDALTCRVAYHAKRLGLNYSALSVRDQSSRWGSCSARRAISLNWRLVLLQPALQDYVILHELAHLSEMNHGPRFWALLDRYDAEREAHELELDRVSSAFMRVGRA